MLDGQEWFDTGDIATLDERGFMHIQDRAKDLIKSGGEWISSVDLENALMGHPAIVQAAVIAIADPKWDERPLAVLVLRPGQTPPSHAQLSDFLAPRFAKWWLPDAYEVVDSIPIGATGKFLKRELRELFAGYTAMENRPAATKLAANRPARPPPEGGAPGVPVQTPAGAGHFINCGHCYKPVRRFRSCSQINIIFASFHISHDLRVWFNAACRSVLLHVPGCW